MDPRGEWRESGRLKESAARNVVQGLVFFGLAVVLGLFVVSQATSANLIASFWKLIVNGR